MSPSGAKVTPQKLRSAALTTLPSLETGHFSRLFTIVVPLTMSKIRAWVENTPSEAYEWPATKVVTLPSRPSSETRARLGTPGTLIDAVGRRSGPRSSAR